jgi:alpha-tubulin suppressor-like RCC1 family protein
LWTSGQLGDSATINRSSPVQIGTSSWTTVSAGGTHTAAIRSDNILFTWGARGYGQLGIGTSGNNISSPVQVGENILSSVSSPAQVGTNSWVSETAGENHTAAIRSDSLLFIWGENVFGQVGDNTTFNRSSPIQIGTSSWTSVNAGFSFTAAIRSDNALFTWGRNNYGQIGDNTTINRSSPVQIGTSSWTMVSTGGNTTFGIFS